MRIKVKNASHKDSVAEYVDKSAAVEDVLGEDRKSWEKYLVFEVENLEEMIGKIDYSSFIVHVMDDDCDFDYTVKIYDYYVE